MRIEWTLGAVRNVVAIANHIALDNPAAAFEHYLEIRDQIGLLADHPRLGRTGRVPGTRELVIARTPYIAIYRIEAEVVLILRVLHGAQRWPPA